MVRTIRIQTNEREEIVAQVRRVLSDFEPLLKQVGAILTAASQRTFIAQADPDGDPWEERYPNQDDPVINFAGIVSDLSGGGDIKGRRIGKRRPVLRDTGALLNSIRDEGAIRPKGPFLVEVGSQQEYAARAQFGGISVQPITDDVREGILKFISSEEGAPFYLRLVGFTSETATVLETDVVPRAYLGLSDESKEKIIDLIENGVGDALGPAEEV